MELMMMVIDPSTLFTLCFAALIIMVLFSAVKRVPQGEEWTVERFGRYTHTMGPGLNIIIPFIDRVGMRVSMRETVFDIPSQDVITRDNAMVKVDGVVFFQVMDAARSAYEVADLRRAIINLTMTNIRTVMGSMNLDELLSHRERINASLLSVVDGATAPWGVKVTRVEIKDITPPPALVESMSRQMKAEREKRAMVLEAEGERQAAILRAEGERQAVILEAEARKEAAFRDAEARERQAEAEGKATQMVSEAISQGNVQAINYFVAQKYLEALKAIGQAENQKVLFLPMETSGVIGSLGGLAELAKETFKQK